MELIYKLYCGFVLYTITANTINTTIITPPNSRVHGNYNYINLGQPRSSKLLINYGDVSLNLLSSSSLFALPSVNLLSPKNARVSANCL